MSENPPEWTRLYAAQLVYTVLVMLVAGVYLAGQWPPGNLALGYTITVSAGYVVFHLIARWQASRVPEPARFVRSR